MMRFRLLDTATGPFAIMTGDGERLMTVWVTGRDDPQFADAVEDRSLQPDLAERLRRYFTGEAVDFSDVPTPEGPDFHRRCWSACRTIARGRTRSYGELAEMAGGGAGAARAAGQAMRRNRLPVIVPCHRVLAAGRRIGGFAGSTDSAGRLIAVKRRLLEIEGALPPVAGGAGSPPRR